MNFFNNGIHGQRMSLGRNFDDDNSLIGDGDFLTEDPIPDIWDCEFGGLMENPKQKRGFIAPPPPQQQQRRIFPPLFQRQQVFSPPPPPPHHHHITPRRLPGSPLRFVLKTTKKESIIDLNKFEALIKRPYATYKFIIHGLKNNDKMIKIIKVKLLFADNDDEIGGDAIKSTPIFCDENSVKIKIQFNITSYLNNRRKFKFVVLLGSKEIYRSKGFKLISKIPKIRKRNKKEEEEKKQKIVREKIKFYNGYTGQNDQNGYSGQNGYKGQTGYNGYLIKEDKPRGVTNININNLISTRRMQIGDNYKIKKQNKTKKEKVNFNNQNDEFVGWLFLKPENAKLLTDFCKRINFKTY